MGSLKTSLGIGLELVLIIGLEFGVQSCVTQSRNKETAQELNSIPKAWARDFRAQVLYSCLSIIDFGLNHPCQGHAPRQVPMCHDRVV